MKLIVDIPAQNPDLYYACRFDAPDPVIFFEHRGTRGLVVNDLECDRARRVARVDRVLSLAEYGQRARRTMEGQRTADIIALLCRERKVRALTIPDSMRVGLATQLRSRRLRVTIAPAPVFPQRLCKTPAELRDVRRAMRLTFRAIDLARQILKASRIGRGDRLQWRGSVLTAERIKAEVTAFLIANGLEDPAGMIIACGNAAVEPHNPGHGPLKAHCGIIVDIFPRDSKTFFYGDATRTFCRGTPSAQLQRMYAAVHAAQRAALRVIRAGIDGKQVHLAVQRVFAAAGFATGVVRGRRQGFIHGTGHGLGLALHEEPVRINASSYILRAGHVVTVEPGLYYPGIGGVRLEDVVVVTKTGCQLLARYPQRLAV